MLQRASPVIFLATHGPDIHKECCFFLAEIGYTLESIGKKSLEITDEIFAYKK